MTTLTAAVGEVPHLLTVFVELIPPPRLSVGICFLMSLTVEVPDLAVGPDVCH